MQVYLNYPVPHITKHANPTCGLIRSRQKPDQRILVVTAENAESALAELGGGGYRFGLTRETNDLWIDLTLGTRAEEDAYLERVRDTLGRHYTPLARAPISEHCA